MPSKMATTVGHSLTYIGPNGKYMLIQWNLSNPTHQGNVSDCKGCWKTQGFFLVNKICTNLAREEIVYV